LFRARERASIGAVALALRFSAGYGADLAARAAIGLNDVIAAAARLRRARFDDVLVANRIADVGAFAVAAAGGFDRARFRARERSSLDLHALAGLRAEVLAVAGFRPIDLLVAAIRSAAATTAGAPARHEEVATHQRTCISPSSLHDRFSPAPTP